MPPTGTALVDAALALPEAARAELAELLAASLDAPPSSLHPAWAAEFQQRAIEVDSQRVRSIPWDDIRREVREQLDSGATLDG